MVRSLVRSQNRLRWPHGSARRAVLQRGPLRSATAGLLLGALLLSVAAVTPAGAVSIELKDVASDRVERQRAAAEGNLPLAGTPDLSRLTERLAEKGVKLGAPILLRAFKSESEFEVWFLKDDQYVLFATYPVCHWSGTLGPKLREGDKQTPEGFYTVTKPQLRHVGRWPRSLNLGFPNVFDKVQARNGSHILVHGGCSSVGCFAMTNSVIEEIYSFTEAAINGGQVYVPVHVFPFRLTDANLASQKDSPWFGFWQNLKEGHDLVERSKRPPRVTVCEGKYKFNDLAPEEGADPGPLAVCGETRAALQTLEQYTPAALAQLSLQMNPSVRSPRSLDPNASPNPRLLLSREDRADERLRARFPLNPSVSSLLSGLKLSPDEARQLSPTKLRASRSPPCSIQRASCRKHLALQDRIEERRVVKSAGRKRQQAQR
jgi:murein L,D-transpeptidase YafK